MPAGRIVTFSTGSACGLSAATSACPDSCTATEFFSSGSSTFEGSRRPSSTRSLAASRSAAVIVVRLSRTALIAASLIRVARSAPENPGVPRAMMDRSTSGASFLPLACSARIALRSFWLGSGTITCRSKRPGRSRAGSSDSGRFVAASTTIPLVWSKPSISDSNWFSVCSRSSLPPMAAPPRRAPPADRVDLIDEDDRRGAPAGVGEQVPDPGRADADEQLHERRSGHRQERHLCLPGHRPGDEGLAGTWRADHDHAARAGRAHRRVPRWVAQEVHHLADLLLHAVVPGYVAEGRGGPLRLDALGARPAEAADAPGQRPLRRPAGPDEQADDQEQPDQAREQGQQQVAAGLGGGDLDIVRGELLGD